MYDAWSVFDDDSETYFLGNEIHGEQFALDNINFNLFRKIDEYFTRLYLKNVFGHNSAELSRICMRICIHLASIKI